MLVIKIIVTVIVTWGHNTLSPLCVDLNKPLSDKQINSRHRNCVIKEKDTNNESKRYCEIKNMYKRIAILKLKPN